MLQMWECGPPCLFHSAWMANNILGKSGTARHETLAAQIVINVQILKLRIVKDDSV
jgi:hypothetical protein